MWKDKLFWFSQPSVVLTNYDTYFVWMFLIFSGAGVIFKLLSWFIFKHPVIAKVWNKLGSATLTTGILGLVWYGFRYENIPFLANRYWAGIIVLILFVWLLFILKYLFTKFRTEKSSYDKMQLNSKYIPGPKR